MLEGLKRMLGLPDQQTYRLACNDIEVVLPEHDADDENCSCPECMEALLQRLSDATIAGKDN